MKKKFAWAVVYKDTGTIVIDWAEPSLKIYPSRRRARNEVKYHNSLSVSNRRVTTAKVYVYSDESTKGLSYDY